MSNLIKAESSQTDPLSTGSINPGKASTAKKTRDKMSVIT